MTPTRVRSVAASSSRLSRSHPIPIRRLAAGEGVARVDPDSPVKVGQRATFAVKADGLQFFDAANGEAIWAA